MTHFSFGRSMGVLLLLLTVILSFMMIHSPGTGDVTTFLYWAEIVYQDGLVAGYSKVVSLHANYFYPPLSVMILYVARAFGNAAELSPLMSFKVVILTFQLLSTGVVLLLSGSYWVAAAFNASLLLCGIGLGYMDVCVAPFLILAFWAFKSRRSVLGTAMFLVACLTKWQPLILAPFIGVYLFEISSLQSCLSAIRRRLFWELTILVAVTLALVSWVFGLAPASALRNAMSDPFLSGNALNVPWIAGFFHKLLFSTSFSLQTELIPSQPGSMYLLPFKIVFSIIFGIIFIRAMRVEKRFEYCLLFSIVGFVTYAIWNSGVHEYHLFVPVILSYMLMILKYNSETRAITVVIATMFNINLFIFYGVTGTELQSRVLSIDLSIVLAILYIVVWLVLAAYAWGVAEPAQRGERSEKRTDLPAAVSD
jgi:hypothetical protein